MGEDEEEDDDDDEEVEDKDSADSADSGDDIEWNDLTQKEALKKDKLYRFGKRLTAESFPQYVLQNIPSRFMSVNEEFNEQTHLAPVPWKRVFYHYKGDEIKLPSNAAQKTVEANYNKIEFEVIQYDTVKEEKGENEEETVDVIDRILQEIPNNYDHIL